MFRPSDLQLVLLTSAAQRADGSLLPPPDSINGEAARIRRSIPPMIKNGIVSEITVANAALAWREDDDARFGAFITDAGRRMLGADPGATVTDHEPAKALRPAVVASPAPEVAPTKIAIVHALLRRDVGATLDELVTATGWQPHTMRAALTRLRQKGHLIAKNKRGDTTCYSLPRVA